MSKTIGAPLDFRALAVPAGDLALDRTSLDALADARHHSRAALAALRAMDLTPVSRDSRLRISQTASVLADAIAELEQLESRARLQP